MRNDDVGRFFAEAGVRWLIFGGILAMIIMLALIGCFCTRL